MHWLEKGQDVRAPTSPPQVKCIRVPNERALDDVNQVPDTPERTQDNAIQTPAKHGGDTEITSKHRNAETAPDMGTQGHSVQHQTGNSCWSGHSIGPTKAQLRKFQLALMKVDWDARKG